MTKKVKSEVSGEGKVQFPYKNIFLISDIHCGVRSSSEEWQENIRSYFYDWFIPFIKANSDKKTDCIFALGDIYDDRKSMIWQ
jgi:metallophosphoesterase superfamily enzyme